MHPANPLSNLSTLTHRLCCRDGCVAEVELVAEEVSLVLLSPGFDEDGRQPLPKLMSEEQYRVRRNKLSFRVASSRPRNLATQGGAQAGGCLGQESAVFRRAAPVLLQGLL